MGPTWGPSGADRTQVGPMLAPWTLLSGDVCVCHPALMSELIWEVWCIYINIYMSVNWIIIGSGNGLVTVGYKAITSTNDDWMLIKPKGTNSLQWNLYQITKVSFPEITAENISYFIYITLYLITNIIWHYGVLIANAYMYWFVMCTFFTKNINSMSLYILLGENMA